MIKLRRLIIGSIHFNDCRCTVPNEHIHPAESIILIFACYTCLNECEFLRIVRQQYYMHLVLFGILHLLLECMLILRFASLTLEMWHRMA